MRRGRRSSGRRSRAGAVAVLVAALLPLILGMMAVSIDLTVLAVARGQLKSAADAAALGAALELALDANGRVALGTTTPTGVEARARARAAAILQAHRVLGAVPVIRPDDEVVLFDGTPGGSATRPDTARVVARRDSAHGGAVPCFFGAIFGQKTFPPLEVQSTARVLPTRPSGIAGGGHLLPIVLSKANYLAMIGGSGSDQYTYDTTTGAVRDGGDGVAESMLYPIKADSAGNWGTINVGVSNNGTSTLSAQIRDGLTAAQVAAEFPTGRLLEKLDTTTTPATPYHTFSGNPGISSGIKDDLASIVGKPVTIPIYDQESGNGNNASYRVIAFTAARLVYVNFKGNPKYVIIQPATASDPAVTNAPGSGAAADDWREAASVRTFLCG